MTKKKLIEVALPLDAINAASAREKSIRHGHPSTLHLWWARRPLAACRAVLFGQLVDDPSSHPDKFPTSESVEIERKRLFGIIEDLVKWENSTNEEVLKRARAEIVSSCDGDVPSVYDPFSGGGSIPLEAQRLGVTAYGSDLNPVAVVIGKAMIEIPPLFKQKKPVHPGSPEQTVYRNGEGLAEDIRFYGGWMRERAFERIGHLYPSVQLPEEHGGGEASIIAWIWARTVPSPDPAFAGVHVPLVSNFLLRSKKGKEAWIEPIVDKEKKSITYCIRNIGSNQQVKKARAGTKSGRATFRCMFSDAAIKADYIDDCASKKKMKHALIAVVAEGRSGRICLSGDLTSHIDCANRAASIAADIEMSHLEVACRGTFASNAQGRRYGFNMFRDYFTDRQLVMLNTFLDLLKEVRLEIAQNALASGMATHTTPLMERGTGAKAYAEAVSVYLALAISKLADRGSTICSWDSSPKMEALRNTFARQALTMTWDFAEANPFSRSSGNFLNNIDWINKAVSFLTPNAKGRIVQEDAQGATRPKAAVVSCDPPYYDNISYADLSDFFYCWLKPALQHVYPDLFGLLTTPKQEELVATPYRHGGKSKAEVFFLDGMSKAIGSMAAQSTDAYPAAIYYAFKQSEVEREGVSSTGWATFLQAVLDAGYAVVGTWPIRTEMANRMIAAGTNALANSVVLVCRKRNVDAETIGRAEFIRSLKRELPPAIEALQRANLSPADMPQSSIGPGMAIFSRCKAVLEADDTPMSVKTALQLINRELDDYLRDIQGEFDPETRFALTWMEQHGFKTGEYGIANSIAMARGISVESVRHAGLVEASGGNVRILNRSEIDPDWEPDQDSHLTIWECSQHLVRALETLGERGAGELLRKIGPAKADATRDLAYCLYDIAANRRKDAAEATSWNGLIKAWPVVTREAAAAQESLSDPQMALEI